jgi:hypothetical protein
MPITNPWLAFSEMLTGTTVRIQAYTNWAMREERSFTSAAQIHCGGA